LRDEVEDHLAAHGCDTEQARQAPHVGEAVFRRHAVATVRLDRGVHTPEARFGRRATVQ
jgi:hypothetical protein